MTVIHTATGYIPITLLAEILAKFDTNYLSSAWGTTSAIPSGATVFDCYETIETELDITDYLTADITDFDDLVPAWTDASKVILELQYHNGTEWQDAETKFNFDATDWKSGTTNADFTLESKTDNPHIVVIEFPEKANDDSIENYRIKIDLDRDPTPTS